MKFLRATLPVRCDRPSLRMCKFFPNADLEFRDQIRAQRARRAKTFRGKDLDRLFRDGR